MPHDSIITTRDAQQAELILAGLRRARAKYEKAIIAREDAARKAYQTSIKLNPRRRLPSMPAMAEALGVSVEWLKLVVNQPMGTTIQTRVRKEAG